MRTLILLVAHVAVAQLLSTVQAADATVLTTLAIIKSDAVEAPALRAGQYEQVNLKLGEKVKIRLPVGYVLADGDITITALNGGSINSAGKELKIAGKASELIDVEFEPTVGRGRYLIEITQAGRSETVEFWAGEEPPSGAAGPARVINL